MGEKVYRIDGHFVVCGRKIVYRARTDGAYFNSRKHELEAVCEALNAAHDNAISTSEAERVRLREALAGVIKEADRETDAFIRARRTLTDSTAALSRHGSKT